MLVRRQLLQFMAAMPLAVAWRGRCPRPGLSDPSGEGDRHHRAGRAGRHHRAAGGGEPDREPRPIVLHREHAGRRRQHRHGRDGARHAGRLHAARRHQQHRHQRQPLCENPLRSLQGLRADFADVLLAARAGGAPVGAGQHRQRTRRAGEGQSRQIQLRIGRARHAGPSRRRNVQAGVRRRHHPCAVQRRRAGQPIHPGRSCADRRVGAADGIDLHPRRPVPRAWLVQQQALLGAARCADHDGGDRPRSAGRHRQRPDGAGRHAEADHRAASRCDGENPVEAGNAREAGSDGLRSGRQHA